MRLWAAERLTRTAQTIGRSAIGAARHAGGVGILVFGIVVAVLRGRVPMREIMAQAFTMGVESLPLVLLTAMLSGVVTTQQGGYQFTGNIPLYVLGSVVTSSIVLELGPVMTAFVLIGRVGARIAAELGTMKVSEQIDALESLGRDPATHLAAPRVIAGTLVTPVLVGMADVAGMLAGLVSANLTVGLGVDSFLYGARLYWHNWDLFYSLCKALTFGMIIPTIAAHVGLTTRGGAEGVGRSTTSSVVAMILAVLVLDAMFPPLLLQ